MSPVKPPAKDERWNDIALNDSASPTPPPERSYFEAYPYLTDPQLDLYDLMSEISEEGFCAGWIGDNEYNIWNAITQGSPAPGYSPINPRLLRRCLRLSTEIAGWIYWADGPQFAPMAQWLSMVEARRESAAAKAQTAPNHCEPSPDQPNPGPTTNA